MKVTYKLDPDKPISDKAMAEIKNAKSKKIIYDDDSPKYSREELEQMIRNTREKGMDRRKYGISLRLDPESLELAKTYGTGYTSLLSKIIYFGIRDPEILKKALNAL